MTQVRVAAFSALTVAAGFLLAGCPRPNGYAAEPAVPQANFDLMLGLYPIPGDAGRAVVLTKDGMIYRVSLVDPDEAPTTFLDLRSRLIPSPQEEEGLLGLAFHPNYANNRQFYIYYTTNNANVVAKYTQSATDPDVADPTGEVLLSVPDFASNHNGGMMEFGPTDGYLYIGTGDGGGADDPQRTAQDTNSLLGKMLRIDVNTTSGQKPYGIPSGNPFAGGGGAPEVFMLGLRNPWRWSFDRMTGDMWIGDVGQVTDEEIDVLKPSEQPGANLGWSMYEGTRCFGNYTCDPTGKFMPQVTRPANQNWRAIIGGQVYRGSCFPDLQGLYFFTDYAARPLQTGKLEANGTVTTVNLPPPAPATSWPSSPASLHADARGELFLTNTAGYVYQIEAGP